MIDVLYDILFFVLPVAGFLFGMHTADRYHRQAQAEQRYALEKQYARLVAGVDADDTGQPYVAPDGPIDESFITHLRSHGRATQQIQ